MNPAPHYLLDTDTCIYLLNGIACVKAHVKPGPCVLPLDTTATKYFGEFKTRLRRAGQIIGDVDLFIAGIAASQNLIVVTNNTDHFTRISEITINNWHAPLPEPLESAAGANS